MKIFPSLLSVHLNNLLVLVPFMKMIAVVEILMKYFLQSFHIENLYCVFRSVKRLELCHFLYRSKYRRTSLVVKKRLKVALWGLSALRPSAYCSLTPNKFPHSSSEAPRTIQMGGTSTSEDGNYYQ